MIEWCHFLGVQKSHTLLKEGHAHKQQLPKTLFISREQPADFLAFEAERQGITVVRVPENQLLLFIGEAREGFREHFSGGRRSEANPSLGRPDSEAGRPSAEQ